MTDTEKVKVYRVTMCVVDHDRVGEESIRCELEAVDWVFANVTKVECTTVDWTDDHPLNYQATQADAFLQMFPSGRAAALDALKDMLKLHQQMAPYVGQMALPDYALLNQAPLKAAAVLKAATK